MTFGELGLMPSILSALDELNYKNPSPIQEGAIPPALKGQDVLGLAQTGTGKTCAFATPILQRLEKPVAGRPVRALILTPTRELALQIYDNILRYGKNLPLKTAVIFGGVSQGPQVSKLKQGVDILVATPGRLTDLYGQKLLNLSKLETFVLDEADRMLDMGFIHDVNKILQWLPEKKQTLFFSATMPPEINKLVQKLLVDPVRVEVTPVSTVVEVIEQEIYMVDKHNKSALLSHIIKGRKIDTALVFTRTKHGANKVVKDLEKDGISAAAIHGNKSQTARQQALADFKAGKIQCLVATDIAARGIDIHKLAFVFNYNLPEVPETYVHRIGRTGRAGHDGVAIAFCDFGEKPLLRDIERLMGKCVPLNESHPFPMTVFEAPKKDHRGRVINSEDQEARNAARERRRQRDEAQQAKSKDNRSQGNQSKGNNRSNQGNQQRTDRRGVRSGKVVDTGSAMPNTQFNRPNPLGEGDQIMDATARMLAPKSLPFTNNNKAANPSNKSAKPQRQSNRNQMNHQRNQNGESHVTQTSRNKGNQQRRNNQNRRPPRNQFDTPPHASSTKDSTEQSSLMKPFYLDF